MPQIIVENLVKTYKVAQRQKGLANALKGLVHRDYTTVHALEGISFTIEPGELVGYIGPNGAGKSTTVKILSGILVPDSGRCEIIGKVPWMQRVEHVSQIGVVFGQRSQLWWDLPVIDSFELLRDIYRTPEKQYRATLDELVESLKLATLLDTPVRQLSLGQRMRCELVASLLHSPPLLFLDEPTIGLDAISKLAVREFIKRLNQERGVTVILTTHDIDDIQSLCTRVMVIGKGRILSDGTLDDLRKHVSRERRMVIDLDNGGCHEPIVMPQVKIISSEGNRLVLSFDPDQLTPAQLIGELSRAYPIKDLLVENPPIEEIIARFYGEMRL